MKQDKLLERRIEEAEDALGMTSIEDRQTSGFKEILPNRPRESGTHLVSPSQSSKAARVKEKFAQNLSAYVANTPVSILPCILSLPETADECANPSAFYDVVLWILADHGFLFSEVDTSGEGQYSFVDMSAALDPEAGIRCDLEVTETKLISCIKSALSQHYAGPSEQSEGAPSILAQVENLAKPYCPELFRCCILNAINSRTGSNQKVENTDQMVLLWQQAWSIPDEILDTELQETCSLRTVLKTLAELCNEGLKLQSDAIRALGTFKCISQEAFACYRDTCNTYQKLYTEIDSEFSCVFSSDYLPEYIKNRLKDWKHVDYRKSGQCSRELPDEFAFDSISCEVNRVSGAHFISIRGELCALLHEHIQQQSVRFSEIPASAMEAAVQNILALSFMNIFSIDEDDEDTGERNEFVTIAPVVSYLMFQRYTPAKRSMDLKRFPMAVLTSPVKQQMTPEMDTEIIVYNMNLYARLCQVYKRFYGKQWNDHVQAVWDAAFLTYTGYKSLYKDPRMRYTLKKVLSSEAFPKSAVLEQIHECLLRNRVSLVHGASARNNWNNLFAVFSRFHPEGPGAPGWAAVEYFEELLKRDDAENGDRSQLKKFISLISSRYSHSSIDCFLRESLNILVGIAQDETADAVSIKYHKLCEEIQLLDAFSESNPSGSYTTYFTIALEYTMRFILEEQCCQRLYTWVTHYIDCEGRKILENIFAFTEEVRQISSGGDSYKKRKASPACRKENT